MKKIMCIMMLVSVFGWHSVSAEAMEESTEDSTEMTSSTSETQPSTIKSAEDEGTITNESDEKLDLPNETESMVIDLGSLLFTVKKNQQLAAQDFYNYIQPNTDVTKFGIKEFQFVDNQVPSTEKMGQFPSSVKLTGVATDGSVKTFLMGYLVINDVATLKITDLKYDSDKKAVTGRTNPKATITYHGEKGYGQGHVFADEKGYFKIGSMDFPGTRWFLTVYDSLSFSENYSDEVIFTIPDYQADSTEKFAPESKIYKENNKNILPQTSVRTDNALIAIGVIILIATSMYYGERKLNLF